MASDQDTASPTVDGPIGRAFALRPGPVDLTEYPTDGVPIGPDSPKSARKAMAQIDSQLPGLQERLFAQSTSGDRRSVLVILQGMDTAGKDGVVSHVIGLVNPGGVHLAAFKRPSPEELAHDFLWRIEKQVPGHGMIGVFNRSQYEDVLVVRVHGLVPREVWSRRFAAINEFERRLTRTGVTVVKCFLHVSPEAQKERLAARLADPTKYWKYNPGDLDERGRWGEYQQAYQDALRRCHTKHAPWYVIPSDRKWYRDWAVAALLTETLQRIDPRYPSAAFDLDHERARVAAC